MLLDARDLHIYDARVWHISDTGYVVWRGIQNGVKKTLRLHRLIVGAEPGQIVDHINRNKLDNRRRNLRVVSFAENIRNSDKYDNAKGYYYDKRKKRWTVDFTRIGVRSLYMDSEKDCIEYVQSKLNGLEPIRKFTPRFNTSGRKLTDEQIRYIFEQRGLGRAFESIGKDVGVCRSTVSRIISGRTKMAKPILNKTKGGRKSKK